MIWTTFDLTDSSGNQLFTRLQISPANSAFAYDGVIIAADTVHLPECSGAASVSLVPNAYAVQCFGRNAETRFFINLPVTIDNTSASAVNYMITDPCQYPVSSSYAVTSSYALNGGGGGSGSAYNYVTAGAWGAGNAPAYTPVGTTVATNTSDNTVWWYYGGQWN